MNFHELEEDVWIHYNNNYYFVFEIKFIDMKTQDSLMGFYLMMP